MEDIASIMASFKVNSLLIYEGIISDIMGDNEDSENKVSEFVIESAINTHKDTKLYLCKLNSSQLEIVDPREQHRKGVTMRTGEREEGSVKISRSVSEPNLHLKRSV